MAALEVVEHVGPWYETTDDAERRRREDAERRVEAEADRHRHRIGDEVARLFDVPRDELLELLGRLLVHRRDNPASADARLAALRVLLGPAVDEDALVRRCDRERAKAEKAAVAARPPLGLPVPLIARRRLKFDGRVLNAGEHFDAGTRFWPTGRLRKLIDGGFASPHPDHLAAVQRACALNDARTREAK